MVGAVRGRRLIAAALVVLVAAAPVTALADDPPQNPPDREVPDYDGRPDPEGDDVAEALLWVPRILTGPLYLFSEYVLRVPIGALVTELERTEALAFLFDLFVWGPERNVGLLPTAFFDFGLAPSGGLYFFWNDFVFDGNDLNLHAATGGADFLSFSARDTIRPTSDTSITLRFGLLKRPDQQLGQIENPLPEDQLPVARYGIERVEGGAGFEWRPWSRNSVGLSATYRGYAFLDEPWREGDRTVGEVYGVDGLPGAYGAGFSSLDLAFHVVVDSRPPGELSQGGVWGEGEVVEHIGFGGLEQSSWISWSLDLTLATDFLGRGRVIGVTGSLRGVNAVGDAVVPFVDLPELGGARGPLPGFQPGLVIGRSVAAAVVHYTWPIYALVDGVLHWGVGNVFGDTYADFDLELLRMSFGLSIAPRFGGVHFLELGFALGTEPFRDGSGIDSVRFVIGARNGL